MLPPLTETELNEKLVTKGHLNVPERGLLPNGCAKGSLIRTAIVRLLLEDGWFPKDWRPDQPFHGGVIELTPPGCRIHWKAEYSMAKFALLRVTRYDDLLEAAEQWVRGMYGESIDVVKIDWEA